MTADDLMRLINRYVEACDDLGEGLFEKPLTTTDALHAKATALHGQILDEVYRLHALAAAQPPAAAAAPELVQRGWLLEWLGPGGKHSTIWSDSDSAAKAIGCPHEPVYALRPRRSEK